MIGWYVHHHGGGHLRRFANVARELRTPVTVLSSLAPPEGSAVDWVQLAEDAHGADLTDVDAGGTLHWVPRHHPGLARRAAQLTAWLDEARPSLIVVDVSVEVSLLARLAGVPVVVVAMPGERTDRAHATAYDLADALIAPWPAHVPTSWPARWSEKTHHVGTISRFDGRPRVVGRRDRRTRRALLLWGAGGEDRTADFAALRESTPDWEWTWAHPGRRLDDEQLWAALCDADVVVTHAGQGAVGDVLAARAPAVVVADSRPFDEQLHTARALAADGVALGLEAWPSPARWPLLLQQARDLEGLRAGTWSNGTGAALAARVVDGLADRHALGAARAGVA